MSILAQPKKRLTLYIGGVSVALAVLLALSGCGGGQSSAATTPPPTAPAPTATTSVVASPTSGGSTTVSGSPCQSNQLSIATVGSRLDASNTGVMFRLQNTSGQRCVLDGYPTVQLLDSAHHALPTHLSQQTSGNLYSGQQPQPVQLNSGGYAYFVMEWPRVPASGQSCPSSFSIAVTPPQATSSLLHTITVAACGGNLTVSPIETQPIPGF